MLERPGKERVVERDVEVGTAIIMGGRESMVFPLQSYDADRGRGGDGLEVIVEGGDEVRESHTKGLDIKGFEV
jgi:hypothetical protein